MEPITSAVIVSLILFNLIVLTSSIASRYIEQMFAKSIILGFAILLLYLYVVGKVALSILNIVSNI